MSESDIPIAEGHGQSEHARVLRERAAAACNDSAAQQPGSNGLPAAARGSAVALAAAGVTGCDAEGGSDTAGGIGWFICDGAS